VADAEALRVNTVEQFAPHDVFENEAVVPWGIPETEKFTVDLFQTKLRLIVAPADDPWVRETGPEFESEKSYWLTLALAEAVLLSIDAASVASRWSTASPAMDDVNCTSLPPLTVPSEIVWPVVGSNQVTKKSRLVPDKFTLIMPPDGA
jgi:hypothetical protein